MGGERGESCVQETWKFFEISTHECLNECVVRRHLIGACKRAKDVFAGM